MHIGFDVSQTGSAKAGCGYYAHALAKALIECAGESRFSLYPGFGDFYFDPLMPLRNPYASACSSYGPRHLDREAAARFWNSDDLESALGFPQIVHANNFWCPLQLRSTRLVYTLYDLGFLIDPAWSTEANRIGCFDGVFRAALEADWIVAISRSSRDHYLATFPHFPAERIRVIHPCSRFAGTVPRDRRPARLDGIKPGEFWLSVGTIEPRKNQRRLARAYREYLDRGGAAMPLVLAGGTGWNMEDFPRYLEELGLVGKVILTGYVADEELVWLYRHCHANLYPSLFEGFGLPVLEGMQFGAATLTADNSSLPEVAGDAAQLLPADDTGAWAEAMTRLAQDPERRQHMQERARTQAARFDWRRGAADLLSLYEEAATAPKRNASCQPH
ncbi:MAG: glycosyltransferase family 4 protein [Pseudomonadales bacterium]|nr:glycosyltransferase family 4 protein [Pseudomonadales bacterium]